MVTAGLPQRAAGRFDNDNGFHYCDPVRSSLPGHRALAAAAVMTAAALVAGCATTVSGLPGAGGQAGIVVVAAENFWGSIAAQLGGGRVSSSAVITNPAADPHSYEPTAADARAFALGKLIIINGIGYDPWAARLVAANPVAGRIVLNVGALLGMAPGANPHQWYSAASVRAVIAALTADYRRLDPAGAGYFTRRERWFTTTALARYRQLTGQIRARYAGTPVGASESIVSPLARSLGLRLLTPYSFLTAISEGSEPTAQDKELIDQQIRRRLIKVYIYNSQNATPDVAAQVAEARSAHIPVTTITETLSPAGATFPQWQAGQLQRLESALQLALAR